VARGSGADNTARCALPVPFDLLLTKLPPADAAAAVSLVGTEFATTRVTVDDASGAAILKHLSPFRVGGGGTDESLPGHPAVFAFSFAGVERAVVRLCLAGVDDTDADDDDDGFDTCGDVDNPWLAIGAGAVAAAQPTGNCKGPSDDATSAASAVDVTMAADSVTLLVLLERYLEWLQVGDTCC
jgi:hypothetical protein